MSSSSQKNSLGYRPRQGKWTKEEEQYVDLLIAEFRAGALPLQEGTTLRSFLSNMINCNPKRVSKKYENTNYNGKHKYEPSRSPMSLDHMRRRRERLQEYESRFLLALQRSKDDLELEEEELRASLEQSRATSSSKEKTSIDTTVAAAAAAAAAEKEDRAMATLLEQHKQKTSASCAGRRPSLVNNTSVNSGVQDRLTAELQSRLDLVNQLSACGSGSSKDLRDLSLSNTANMTLTLPSGFASPCPAKPQISNDNAAALKHLASCDLLASLKQPSKPSFGGLPGQLARQPELSDDPLAWQMRRQRQASAAQKAQRMMMGRLPLPTTALARRETAGARPSAAQKAQRMMMGRLPLPTPGVASRETAETRPSAQKAQRLVIGRLPLPTPAVARRETAETHPFQLSQYLRASNPDAEALRRVAGDLPYPTLPDSEHHRHLPPASRSIATMDQLSQLQLASLVAREERRSFSSCSAGLGQDILDASRHRRASIVSEQLEMMKSLKRKREHQEALEMLRPFKRLR